MSEKQELYCHNCGNYVQFEVDMELNGNHVLKCPSCGHEHCRVVKDGVISEDRWDSRNPTYNISTNVLTYSQTSTFTNYGGTTVTTSNSTNYSTASYFIYNSWMDTTTTN